jgi:glycosyl transferase family 25
MQTPPFLTLVINLDRAHDRMMRLAQRLLTLGVSWERVPAVDGQAIDWRNPSHLDLDEFHRRHGKSPLAGEVGCYLSHVKAIETFLASGAQYALILEDDIQLNDDLPSVLRSLQDCPQTWDLVKLSGVHRGTPIKLYSLDDGHDLVVLLTKCTGASAYVLNRRAAETFLPALLPMRIPFDHEFDRAWHWRIKTRAVLPYPCVHDQMVASTINYEDRSRRRFSWYRRFPAYAWRLRNAWCQLKYGVGQWLHALRIHTSRG